MTKNLINFGASESVDSSSIFVWTEVFNCGELADIVVSSYLAHHGFPVHVFGYPDDLQNLAPDQRIIPVAVSDLNPSPMQVDLGLKESYLRAGFESGHLGTARLFATIFSGTRAKFLVHFDADIIFVGSSVAMILEALLNGFSIAGLRRPYRYNVHGRSDVWGQPDCIDTVCIGLRSDSLPKWGHKTLVRKIQGRGTQFDRLLGHRNLDFFDPVTHKIIKTGSVAYLDSMEDGPSAQQNKDSDFYQSFVQVWSAVGTGCALTKATRYAMPEVYAENATRNYHLYAHYLLGRDYPGQLPAPGEVEDRLSRLSRETWTIS